MQLVVRHVAVFTLQQIKCHTKQLYRVSNALLFSLVFKTPIVLSNEHVYSLTSDYGMYVTPGAYRFFNMCWKNTQIPRMPIICLINDMVAESILCRLYEVADAASPNVSKG